LAASRESDDAMHQGRRRTLTLLFVAALTASCAPGPTPSVTASGSVTVPATSAATGSASASPATGKPPSPTETTETTLVRAYFYLGGEPGSAGLVPVLREVGSAAAVSGAMNALLAGPTAEESGERTITSAIPEGSRVLDLTVADGVATVDLSHEFESGGGSTSMFVRLGQVVFTLTQFSTVQAVRFRIDGQPVTVFSGEGIVLDHPQTRADSGGVLPAIFVDLPVYGGALGNPARISGSADVFEAAFRVTILDAAGTAVADVPVKASCGTGCRGSFDVTVPYPVDHAQPGTLRVWDGSMKNGSPANVREYPVELVPAG
jgi:germination protein M